MINEINIDSICVGKILKGARYLEEGTGLQIVGNNVFVIFKLSNITNEEVESLHGNISIKYGNYSNDELQFIVINTDALIDYEIQISSNELNLKKEDLEELKESGVLRFTLVLVNEDSIVRSLTMFTPSKEINLAIINGLIRQHRDVYAPFNSTSYVSKVLKFHNKYTNSHVSNYLTSKECLIKRE